MSGVVKSMDATLKRMNLEKVKSEHERRHIQAHFAMQRNFTQPQQAFKKATMTTKHPAMFLFTSKQERFW